MAEKKFLAYVEDLEPISTQLDTVISDTTKLKSTTSTIDSTSKDTNSKVGEITEKANSVDTEIDNIATEDNLSIALAKANEILNKLNEAPIGNNEWYWSDPVNGSSVVLINNEELISGTLELDYDGTTRKLNPIYVLKKIVPPISGVYKVSLTTQFQPSANRLSISIVTKQAVLFDYLANNTCTKFIDDEVGIIYPPKFNTSDFANYQQLTGGNTILALNGDTTFSPGETDEMNVICRKNEPFYIMVANDDTSTTTVQSVLLNITYYPTKEW